MTKESNTSMTALDEAGRIINEINNLKIELNDFIDFYEKKDKSYYLLRDYVTAIEEMEYNLLNNINLPHCEWAAEAKQSIQDECE